MHSRTIVQSKSTVSLLAKIKSQAPFPLLLPFVIYGEDLSSYQTHNLSSFITQLLYFTLPKFFTLPKNFTIKIRSFLHTSPTTGVSSHNFYLRKDLSNSLTSSLSLFFWCSSNTMKLCHSEIHFKVLWVILPNSFLFMFMS